MSVLIPLFVLSGCGSPGISLELPDSPSASQQPGGQDSSRDRAQDSEPSDSDQLPQDSEGQQDSFEVSDSAERLEDAVEPDGSRIFDETVIHELSLDIPSASWQALLSDPRSYATATFTWEGASYEIAIRAKGNTQFRTIDDKPSLVLDFNRVVKEQKIDGLPSVYLHNMTYDASMMHEHLAYAYFRSMDLPASRTAYARLTVNGQLYGLYLFVEKQNRVYREQWWGDSSGSLFETGSFNHGCDLSDVSGATPCDCFETDDLGSEEDPLGNLAELCTVVSGSDEGWYEAVQEQVRMDYFLRGMAAEMVIAHWDNYGWNKNNWRIYHEPSEDRWYFTPWSTDLSFGWYPWSGDPRCGHYGQGLTEYNSGYLLGRCWGDSACRSDLKLAVEEAVGAWERFDMPSRLRDLDSFIQSRVYEDPRRWYSYSEYQGEVDCALRWTEDRAESVQIQLDSL